MLLLQDTHRQTTAPVLQTFATQKAIEALGHEAVCINYIRTDELPENQTKALLSVSRWNKNTATRLLYSVTQKTKESTSGGIFIPLAKSTLEKGGVVFGCAYDENLVARHIAVEKEADLHKLQGSKYVQSDLSGIYSRVKSELKDGRNVLFSGTGCQVAGLRSFLGKDFDNLITVDIVCHGVPSPKLFEKYIGYLGSKLGEPVKSYNFRSKKRHGRGLFYDVETDNIGKGGSGFDDPYYNAFLNCKTYREGCYNCRFANCDRQGDITLADFWGI